MRVTRLVCANFRNLAEQSIEFSPGVNLIVGENGQGKTNLLEAVQFFKLGRSFRAVRDTEVIRRDADFCRWESSCTLDSGDTERFGAAIQRDGTKAIKLGGKELTRLSHLVGRYPCVLFGPQDLQIVSGGPDHRRRFVDMVGGMSDPRYIQAAREYRRILQQRNAALKARASDYEMNIWNERIITAGAEFIDLRARLVATIEEELLEQARSLNAPFSFGMDYDCELMRETENMSSLAGPDEAAPGLADVFAMKLGAVEQDERRRTTTLVGPHRDDVRLVLDGSDLRRFGSQGQRRLFAILLKLAELAVLEKRLGEKCVLLLDDVFSEFDRTIIERLQKLVDGTRQVFVTSPVDIDWTRSGARVYRVRHGRVTPAEEEREAT